MYMLRRSTNLRYLSIALCYWTTARLCTIDWSSNNNHWRSLQTELHKSAW